MPAGYWFSLFVTVAFPLGATIWFSFRKDKRIWSFLAGVAAFFVSQICIRIPLIQYGLSQIDAFTVFMTLNPRANVLFMGFSAGLFESLGRYFSMRFLIPSRRSWADGVAFGMGHGAVEALLIVGVVYILYPPQIAQADNLSLWMAGIERLSAFALHTGLSVLVMRGLTLHKLRYLFVAILIHGSIDSALGFLKLANFTIVQIELAIAFAALSVLGYAFLVKKRWEKIS